MLLRNNRCPAVFRWRGKSRHAEFRRFTAASNIARNDRYERLLCAIFSLPRQLNYDVAMDDPWTRIPTMSVIPAAIVVNKLPSLMRVRARESERCREILICSYRWHKREFVVWIYYMETSFEETQLQLISEIINYEERCVRTFRYVYVILTPVRQNYRVRWAPGNSFITFGPLEIMGNGQTGFYRASVIEKSTDINSFALVKRKGISIVTLACFKLMSYRSTFIVPLSLEKLGSCRRKRLF